MNTFYYNKCKDKFTIKIIVFIIKIKLISAICSIST